VPFYQVECGAVRQSAVPCVRVRCRASECGAVRQSAVPCVRVRFRASECGAVRQSAVPCVRVRCRASECGAVRQSAVPFGSRRVLTLGMPIEWGANSKTRAQSAKPAPNDPPPNRRKPRCSARVTERRVGARCTKTRRFQAVRTLYVSPCRNLVVVRGPRPSLLAARNGRGRTSSYVKIPPNAKLSL